MGSRTEFILAWFVFVRRKKITQIKIGGELGETSNSKVYWTRQNLHTFLEDFRWLKADYTFGKVKIAERLTLTQGQGSFMISVIIDGPNLMLWLTLMLHGETFYRPLFFGFVRVQRHLCEKFMQINLIRKSQNTLTRLNDLHWPQLAIGQISSCFFMAMIKASVVSGMSELIKLLWRLYCYERSSST